MLDQCSNKAFQVFQWIVKRTSLGLAGSTRGPVRSSSFGGYVVTSLRYRISIVEISYINGWDTVYHWKLLICTSTGNSGRNSVCIVMISFCLVHIWCSEDNSGPSPMLIRMLLVYCYSQWIVFPIRLPGRTGDDSFPSSLIRRDWSAPLSWKENLSSLMFL
jgi:hypothetical protein